MSSNEMNRGLTLIEIIVAIGIVLILLTVVTIPFKRMNETQVLSKETQNVASMINHARSMSLSSKGGVPHGVHLESSQVVLFDGTSYNASDPDNVSISLHPLASISDISLTGGTSDITFDQLSGVASASGTITVSLVASSTQTRIITVNATGIIDVSR